MPIKIVKNDADVSANNNRWVYSSSVKSHFFHPQNLVEDIKKFDESKYDGIGVVGSPACGDMMKLWVKIDKKNDRIRDLKWQTFGCASAIASTSMLSVMVTEKGGMKIENALKLKPQDILARLGGLPPRKIHCSVLGDKALRKAINDYFRKSEQYKRIVTEGFVVIDPDTKITDKDIEEAVLEGADTIEKLQRKLKVGINDKKVKAKAEALMKKFMEKYYA
ncbi:MAG: nitrogen-fixing NifU domain-containing protein, nitrogen fixation protein NifU [Candidatus Peregrinibacteria bacterium GW2011_GWF2_43_17]|nr:MAG: nitrogen-fixing NifU domain-containing protein, nitrogen fixation protein NifU [Candidatus Peregrinibacteria bacterium GW2011_GWF2_43_17]KKT20238.1 MAG: Nitrogen-fixing NifU domain protein [Candidatus Peregrinibacteria bacterium GW2011_GWA2_43_8]